MTTAAPSTDPVMSPDLARDLSRKLTSVADGFEQHKPLRRPVTVADQLRGLDD